MNIKRIGRYFIIFFIPIFILGSFISVIQARNGSGKILSPDKTKNIQFFRHENQTHIFCNFHKLFRIGGSNVAFLNVDTCDIKVRWIDNHSLEIRHPKNAEISPPISDPYFFGDTFTVTYIPE